MSAVIRIRAAELADAEAIAEAEYSTAENRGLLNALPGEIPLEAFREKIRALAALTSRHCSQPCFACYFNTCPISTL